MAQAVQLGHLPGYTGFAGFTFRVSLAANTLHVLSLEKPVLAARGAAASGRYSAPYRAALIPTDLVPPRLTAQTRPIVSSPDFAAQHCLVSGTFLVNVFCNQQRAQSQALSRKNAVYSFS